jgi:hypothetical protein
MPVSPAKALRAAGSDRCLNHRAAVERYLFGPVDRRLTVFSADDDKGSFGQSPAVQCAYHLPDRCIDKRNGVGEAVARCRCRIFVAAALELLPDADGLEVHAKQHRRAAWEFAGMIEAVDFA